MMVLRFFAGPPAASRTSRTVPSIGSLCQGFDVIAKQLVLIAQVETPIGHHGVRPNVVKAAAGRSKTPLFLVGCRIGVHQRHGAAALTANVKAAVGITQ